MSNTYDVDDVFRLRIPLPAEWRDAKKISFDLSADNCSDEFKTDYYVTKIHLDYSEKGDV